MHLKLVRAGSHMFVDCEKERGEEYDQDNIAFAWFWSFNSIESVVKDYNFYFSFPSYLWHGNPDLSNQYIQAF